MQHNPLNIGIGTLIACKVNENVEIHCITELLNGKCIISDIVSNEIQTIAYHKVLVIKSVMDTNKIKSNNESIKINDPCYSVYYNKNLSLYTSVYYPCFFGGYQKKEKRIHILFENKETLIVSPIVIVNQHRVPAVVSLHKLEKCYCYFDNIISKKLHLNNNNNSSLNNNINNSLNNNKLNVNSNQSNIAQQLIARGIKLVDYSNVEEEKHNSRAITSNTIINITNNITIHGQQVLDINKYATEVTIDNIQYLKFNKLNYDTFVIDIDSNYLLSNVFSYNPKTKKYDFISIDGKQTIAKQRLVEAITTNKIFSSRLPQVCVYIIFVDFRN